MHFYIQIFRLKDMIRFVNRGLSCIVSALIILLMPFAVSAQILPETVSYGVAQIVEIKDPQVSAAMIVSTSKDGFFLTTKEYDENIYGVVAELPAITFIDTDDYAQKQQVVTTGNALVQVSAENGPIQEGDPITSTTKKGIGMKATKPGMVVGTALENYNPQNKEEVGKINIKVEVRYFSFQAVNSSLLDVFKLSLFTAANEQPPIFFKYFTSGLVVIGSILLGFYFFGRVAAKGVDALGRNPLASKMIQLGIIINVIITIATIASGLIIAIIILRL